MRPDRVLALVRFNTSLLIASPGPILSRLLMPILMVVALRPIYQAASGSGGTVSVVAGVLVLVSLLTTGIVGTSILSERLWNTWDRLRSTAAGPFEILVGKTAPLLVVLLVQQVLVLVFAVFAYDLPVQSAWLLGLVVLVWGCAVLCAGFALGAFVRSPAALSAAQDIGSFLLSGLGGALIPLAVMPSWLQALAHLSPAYWAVSALRGALTGDPSTVWWGVAAVAVFGSTAAVIAVIAYVRLR
jgi:ABC-2 type transport system permease protein